MSSNTTTSNNNCNNNNNKRFVFGGYDIEDQYQNDIDDNSQIQQQQQQQQKKIGQDTSSFYRDHVANSKQQVPHSLLVKNRIESLEARQQQQQQQHHQPPQEEQHQEVEEELQEMFECDSCNVSIPMQCRMQHLSSTVHLLSASTITPKKYYHIPMDNPGYRMMKDQFGWEEEQGLGVENQGALDPIPTRLKNDYKGVGNPTAKAKVSHTLSDILRSKRAGRISQAAISPIISAKLRQQRQQRQKQRQQHLLQEFK
ncbi:hypothetical protein SAMD00019534_102160 [Acytostelium subglobosum LB1]|uniref:hypothetical protein n=1 Tax=Acytostelium subglobosum LB1 TaxID=1410327 RepID=UPI000644CE2E|nr:hypothetical protein SAMD00019534_102160 [Acytostelium subglobosum LB1]GAM27041.1 hypothetical protein SAMD00019534_102160 [Acytostelium subglobosum LB1]|eukprot:XP_012749921.1 hypothetical protein SAMD00019534_102160 [Acytostelium subglobosum LB1]